VVDEQRHDEADSDDPAPAVPALVEAQLESARAEVFRAYVRSREKARELVAEEARFDQDRERRDP
jgi:hypothetical protein